MPTGPNFRPTGFAAAAVTAEDRYAASGADQAALLARYPGLAAKSDAELIELVTQPPAGVGLMDDVDEASAAAAIILERRLAAAVARGGGGAKGRVAAGRAGR